MIDIDKSGNRAATPGLQTTFTALPLSPSGQSVVTLLLCATLLAPLSPAFAQAKPADKPGAPAPASAAAKSSPSIQRIEARLYYHGSGKFSKPIDENFALHNTIIGEGSADEPSEATLVTVVVNGTAPDNSIGHVLLEVTDTSGGKRKAVLKQRAPLGFLKDGQTRSQVAFWLYDTGCGKLEMTARIGIERIKEPRGVHPAEYGKPVTRTIVYQCGE